jgi:hypothetical protein
MPTKATTHIAPKIRAAFIKALSRRAGKGQNAETVLANLIEEGLFRGEKDPSFEDWQVRIAMLRVISSYQERKLHVKGTVDHTHTARIEGLEVLRAALIGAAQRSGMDLRTIPGATQSLLPSPVCPGEDGLRAPVAVRESDGGSEDAEWDDRSVE